MSKRIQRVNKLLQREISDQLRLNYRSDAVKITISSVETSADLRNTRIFYSVLGDETDLRAAKKLFQKIGKDLHERVSKVVILKYFPRFEFLYDPSLERGSNILNLLDALDNNEA
jgi:ribosome-binding factor A